MMSGLLNTQLMTVLEKTLDFRSQRHEMLASNIANKDTPGYQAGDLVFENNLKSAMNADLPGPLQTSDFRHFDGNQASPLATVKANRIHSAAPFVGFDGNTVDLDKEMAKMAENQLMYNATSRMVGYQVRQMKLVLE